MTKIFIDSAAYQSERHANVPADLARRLEWRLQWEKAQLENLRTSQHNGEPQAGKYDSSIDTVESGHKEKHEVFTQTYLRSEKSPFVKAETRWPGRSDMNQQKLIFESSTTRQSRTLATSLIISADSGGVGRPLHVIAKSPVTVRPMSMPLNQQLQSAGIHIYQGDGKVEVALRNTGLNRKDGVVVMTALKRDLATLGMKLTRLTLNGELLLQTEATCPKGLVIRDSDTNETPIDKIY